MPRKGGFGDRKPTQPKLAGAADAPEFNVTAFELTEARLLIEGEAAALAAPT